MREPHPDQIGERLLHAIAETTSDAIIVADSAGRVVRFNRAAERLFGWQSSEIVGRPLTVLMPERYREAHTRGLLRVRTTGETSISGRIVELEALRKDGEEVPIELTVSPVVGDPEPLFIGIARDVTRRRRAEEALRRSEQSFRQLVELSPEALVVLRGDLVLYVNAALRRLLGYDSNHELVGRPILELLHEDDRNAAQTWLEACVEQNASSAKLLRAVRRDSVGVSLQCRAARLDFDGTPSVVLMAHDVTDQRRTETELRKLTAFLDSIIENIPNMIFVKDAVELRFERFNRAGEELLGMSRSELIGKNDYDFFPPDQAAFFQARDRETLAAGAVVDIPEEPIDTKGGRRYLHTKKIPIKDSAGQALYLLGISEDITERLDHDRELERARRATELANRELEAFSYSVSHDLRAPLRAMDGFSLALLEEYGERFDEQGRMYLERIRAGSQRMARLIEELLGLAKVTRVSLERQRVDLTSRAAEIFAQLRASEPHRAVETTIEPNLEAEGDPLLLSLLLENLLGNAWKFTARRAPARIDVGRVDTAQGDAFFVRDNGAGFDMDHAKKLFGAFQRLHSTSDYEGTGIGLATARRIVERHGGRIWAEARPEQGATFFFTLGRSEA